METVQSTLPFALGQTVITQAAAQSLEPVDVYAALRRHSFGDWGELDPEDVASNERSLLAGCRLLSAYTDRNGVKFWIITDAGHQSTTVLLPEDY